MGVGLFRLLIRQDLFGLSHVGAKLLMLPEPSQNRIPDNSSRATCRVSVVYGSIAGRRLSDDSARLLTHYYGFCVLTLSGVDFRCPNRGFGRSPADPSLPMQIPFVKFRA